MKKRPWILLALLAFTLGVHGGHIALWRDGSSTPVRVFPVRTEMLPPADARALQKGIRIENETELAHALEDYLS